MPSSGDRPHRVDDRSRRHPGQVRRHQRLWRSRPDLRPDDGCRAASLCRADGHPGQGLGADHVVWGTDAVWTGAPQWQIEGAAPAGDSRRDAAQARLHPLGPADGPVKRRHLRRELGQDVPLRRQEGGVARRSLRRAQDGLRAPRPRPSNLRYGSSFLRDQLRHHRAGMDRTARRGPAARRLGGAGPADAGRDGGLPGRRAAVCTTLAEFIARRPPSPSNALGLRCWPRSVPTSWRPASTSCRCRSRRSAIPVVEEAPGGSWRPVRSPRAGARRRRHARPPGDGAREGLRRVVYRQLKPPVMWKLTPAAGLADPDAIDRRSVFLLGSVRRWRASFRKQSPTARSAWRWPAGPRCDRAGAGGRSCTLRNRHELVIEAGAGKVMLSGRRPRGGAGRRSGRLHDLQPDPHRPPQAGA